MSDIVAGSIQSTLQGWHHVRIEKKSHASGGSDNAMAYLGDVASDEGRWADAEAWQLAAMMDGDGASAVRTPQASQH